jgi:hypothetical protein
MTNAAPNYIMYSGAMYARIDAPTIVPFNNDPIMGGHMNCTCMMCMNAMVALDQHHLMSRPMSASSLQSSPSTDVPARQITPTNFDDGADSPTSTIKDKSPLLNDTAVTTTTTTPHGTSSSTTITSSTNGVIAAAAKQQPFPFEPLRCRSCKKVFVNDPNKDGIQCPCGVHWRHEQAWEHLTDAELRSFLNRKDQRKLKAKIGWRVFKLPMPKDEGVVVAVTSTTATSSSSSSKENVAQNDVQKKQNGFVSKEEDDNERFDEKLSNSDDEEEEEQNVEYYAGNPKDTSWRWNNYYNPSGPMELVASSVTKLIGFGHVRKFKFLVGKDVLDALEEDSNDDGDQTGEFDWARKFMTSSKRPASFIFISPKRLLHAQNKLWGRNHKSSNRCSVLLPRHMVDKLKALEGSDNDDVDES